MFRNQITISGPRRSGRTSTAFAWIESLLRQYPEGGDVLLVTANYQMANLLHTRNPFRNPRIKITWCSPVEFDQSTRGHTYMAYVMDNFDFFATNAKSLIVNQINADPSNPYVLVTLESEPVFVPEPTTAHPEPTYDVWGDEWDSDEEWEEDDNDVWV